MGNLIWAIACLTALGSNPQPTQEPGYGPPPGPPPMAPIVKTWAADEVTELQTKVTLVFKESGTTSSGAGFCMMRCLGGKHLRHEDCDTSCDERCTRTHHVKVDPYYNFVDLEDFRLGFYNAAKQIGAPSAEQRRGGLDLAAMWGAELNAIRDDPARSVNKDIPHWESRPCMVSTKSVIVDWYDVMLTYNFVRYDTRPDGTRAPVKGPSTTALIGNLMIPRKDGFVTEWQRDACRCRVVMTDSQKEWLEDMDDYQRVVEDAKKKAKPKTPPPPPDSGVQNKETGLYLGPKDLEKAQVMVACNNVDEAICTATNPCSWPVTLVIEPGTVCVPDDSEFQKMCFLAACVLVLPPKAKVEIPLGPIAPSLFAGAAYLQKPTRISCLEMNKRPPSPNVKYKLDATAHPDLSRIASLISKQLVQGPNDQAKLWIYTDHATFAQLDQRLLPPPFEAEYLQLCYELATEQGVDFSSADFRPLLDPSLLSGRGDMSSKAARWCVDAMARNDAAKLAESIKTQFGPFGKLLAPGAKKPDVQRVADLGSSLCFASSLALQTAGLDLLRSVVPAGLRGAILGAKGLSGARALVLSREGAVSIAALEVIDLYADKAAYPFVAEAAKNGFSPEAKARAAEVLKKLKS